MRSRSRGTVMVALALSLIIAPLLIFRILPDRSKGAELGWATSGNYIVSYGPVKEPYPSTTDNTYYLYSPSGEEIGREKGPGSWSPIALPTRGGSYLYFADKIRQSGGNGSEISVPYRSPIVNFDGSPNGSFSIAILNTSQSAAFSHSVMLLKDDGEIIERDFPSIPHSLAVGDSEALIVGNPREGEGNANENELYLLDTDGNLTKIPFPPGYDVETDFKYPYANYLGDGKFEVLQGHSEGRKTHLTSFEVSVDSAKKQLDVHNIHPLTMTLSEDFAITRTLPNGENGVIDKSGNVYINRRDLSEPEQVGHIEGFSADNFIRMKTPGREPKFGLRRAGKIEVRKWNDPDAVLFSVDVERSACGSPDCDVASISETYGK